MITKAINTLTAEFSADLLLWALKMRMQDLLEDRYFDDSKFVAHKGDKREIDYDLIEDLIHFMHNDDHAYRRHMFPAIARCIDSVDHKKDTKHNIFEPAVKNSYKMYIEKFPIRELPDSLDEEMCEEICNKLHEETLQHIQDGVYKD